MKLRIYLSGAAVMAVSLFPVAALAEDSPADFVRGVANAINSQRSFSAAIDAVDWSGAFDKLAPADRRALQINSPQQLREHEVELYSGMGEKMLAGLSGSLKQAKDEQWKMLEKMRSTAVENIDRQLNDAQELYGRVKYEVGEFESSGKSATVDVAIELDGVTRHQKVAVHQVDGSWRLDEAAPINPSGVHGGLLGTPIVMPGVGFVRGSR